MSLAHALNTLVVEGLNIYAANPSLLTSANSRYFLAIPNPVS